MIDRFREVILSKRRSSSIHNFEELVSILVTRDFVDPFNKSTWGRLDDVCKKIAERSFIRPQPTAAPEPQPPPPPVGNTPQHESSVVPGEVVNFLSTRISFSWRNFARGLKVSGSDIDRIDSMCGTNNSECVKQVLLHYEKIMPWTSDSRNIIEDIYRSLKLLRKDYLIDEFNNLTKMHR
ncbi:hypothetical protein ONE63_007108 [Megalurothrips usitatus]|uniref:Death domain-containing protein n=1 Tax=Megalurothrips usitatus TaxID=439358 RepID=A0AAV7XTI7_9NEOP|nr:hypothetical protein ONE63_007108 [Megalurothrips usitatus]